MEDNFRWKKTFNAKRPLMEVQEMKTTFHRRAFNGRQPLIIEYELPRNTIIQSLMGGDL